MSKGKLGPVVTAADACRVPVFSPTRRAGGLIERKASSSWGEATISGYLDQRHHDVIDAVIHCAWTSRSHDTGDVTVRVDSAELRRTLGWERWRYDQIRGCLLDLISARVSLRCADLTEWSGILMRVCESGVAAPSRRGSRRALARAVEPDPRREGASCRGGLVWDVMISRAWLELVRRMKCRYPPEVWRLRHGVSQALARMILSHKSPRMRLGTVLLSIGIENHPARAAGAIVDDADALGRMGIVIDIEGGYVSVRGPDTQSRRPDTQSRRPDTQSRSSDTQSRSI